MSAEGSLETQPTGVRSRPDGPFDLHGCSTKFNIWKVLFMSAEGSPETQPTGVRSRPDGRFDLVLNQSSIFSSSSSNMSAEGSPGTQPTGVRSRPDGPFDLGAQPKFNILKVQFKHVSGSSGRWNSVSIPIHLDGQSGPGNILVVDAAPSWPPLTCLNWTFTKNLFD